MSDKNKDPQDPEGLPARKEVPPTGNELIQALRKLPEPERLKAVAALGVTVVHSFS